MLSRYVLLIITKLNIGFVNIRKKYLIMGALLSCLLAPFVDKTARSSSVLDLSNVCPSFKSQNIYPVPTASNKLSCPGNGSKVIYVSASGNDSNNGLTVNSPVKTVSKAMQLIRKNSPDWIVLKRGETFSGGLGKIRSRKGENSWGGKLVDRPLVISSYGKSLKRPIVKASKNGIDIWGPFRNVTISGLELYSKPGTGGTGIRTLYEGINYVIHNNYISGFGVGINIQAKVEDNKRFSKVFIKDNIITDSASSGEGHSQGAFIKGVEKLSIEGNVIDRCGWYLDRNGELPNSRIATKFNHCLYLQNGGYPATVKNNIITRASSHGLQARSGGVVVNNLFARNPIQFFLSSKGLNGDANQSRMIAKNNVVLEANDINYQMPRGIGIQHNNAYFALYENNIMAHVLSLSKSNKRAIDIVCKTNDVHTSISGQCRARFRNNLVFNWGNDFGGYLVSAKDFENDLAIEHQVINNHFAITDSRAKFIDVKRETLENKYLFHNNTYSSQNIKTKDLFSLPGKAKASFPEWKNNVEKTAKGVNTAKFVDPCRTMATYYDDFILGNTNNNNCEIMHDNKLFEQFINLAKQNNSMTEKSSIEAKSVINYVKEGFERRP